MSSVRRKGRKKKTDRRGLVGPLGARVPISSVSKQVERLKPENRDTTPNEGTPTVERE